MSQLLGYKRLFRCSGICGRYVERRTNDESPDLIKYCPRCNLKMIEIHFTKCKECGHIKEGKK